MNAIALLFHLKVTNLQWKLTFKDKVFYAQTSRNVLSFSSIRNPSCTVTKHFDASVQHFKLDSEIKSIVYNLKKKLQ